MRVFVLFGLSVLLLMVQSVLLAPVALPFPRPDLLLLLAMTWAAAYGRGDGLVAAAVAGGLSDVVGAGVPGAHILALLPGVLAALLCREAVEHPLVFSVVAVLVATFSYYLVLAALQSATGLPLDWLPVLAGVVPFTAMVNLAFIPLFHAVAAGARSRRGPSGLGPTTRSRPLGGGEL